jgi:hypothetical protein
MAQHNAPQQLNDLLIAKNFDVNALDSAGQPAADPAQAKVFNFNWVAESGKDYGTVVATIGENNDLTVYTGDNVGKQMEGQDKDEWFKFLEQIRTFAKRNLMTFSVQNLNKLKYSQQGQAAMKEGLHESWMGRKDRSWNGGPTEARLMIKHKRVIGEGEARFRYIESLFIETVDGERFKLPFTKLSGGKAMLEHVRQGGRPYDPRGNHIATIVTEMNLLSRFRRANQGKIFEGETAHLVEQAEHHYETLRYNLKSLGSRTGYKKYFEAWDPTALNDEDVIIEDLRYMFVEQNIDSRIEQALPLLSRLQKQEDAMKEIGIFEGWMNCLSEGTWALPDTPEKQQKLIQLLSDELPVGPDATNATELLYDLIGDDDLFDQLGDLAREDANADARTIVINKLEQMSSNPAVAQVIGKLKIEKQAPPPEAPPAEPVAEATLCETCNEAVCECGQYESINESIERLAELSGTGMQRVFKNGQWVKPEPKPAPKPVNELSSDTLKSYIKKATSSGEENSASNLASRAAAKLADPEGDDDGNDDDEKSYLRSKGIARAVDRLEEISDQTVQNYKDKAWDEFARGNDRRGAGIGRALDKQRGAFGHVKTTNQKTMKESPVDIEVAISNEKYSEEESDFIMRVLKANRGQVGKPGDKRQGFEFNTMDDARSFAASLPGKCDAMIFVDGQSLDEEQVNELSPKTLGSYVKQASSDRAMRNFDQGVDMGQTMHQREPSFGSPENSRKDDRRRSGIIKAVNRLVKEEDVEEASDTVKFGKDGKPSSWSHIGDWEKVKKRDGKPVDPRGEVTNLAGRELQRARKIADLKESGMGDVDLTLQEIARGNIDIMDIYANPKTAVEMFVQEQLHEKAEQVAREQNMDLEGDIDDILQRIQRELEAEYGTDDNMDIEMDERREYPHPDVLKHDDRQQAVKYFGEDETEESAGGGNWLEEEPKPNLGKEISKMKFGDKQSFSLKDLMKETTALTGQYGHSGKLEPVQGTNADMMDRIRFLAGITK